MPGEKDKSDSEKEKQPPGGHDRTPLHPARDSTFTIKITFHSATNIPVADFNDASADPYVLAQINTGRPTRHERDPPLRFRTHTIRQSTEPKWDSQWIVAGIPSTGCTLKARIYDEDPGNHDDRLGTVIIETGPINERWNGLDKVQVQVKKKGADLRAYGLRWCASAVHKDRRLHAKLNVSMEVIEQTKEEVGKAYTLNSFYRIHYSPIIGRMVGTKTEDHRGAEKYE
jgi:hypothetical protein